MTSVSISQQPFGRTYGGSAAENYERFFVPGIGAPLAAQLIAEADLKSGERVLDVACGTGIVARLAAERVGASGTVAGLDSNAGMLEVARSSAPANLPIRWYETTAESMPIPDDSFDVVFCQLGLQFVEDKNAAMREMHRVVVPGGRVLVSVPTPSRFFDILHDTLARYFPASAGFMRLVFSLNDTAQIEQLSREAGFREVAVSRKKDPLHLPSPQEFLWQYVRSTPLVGMLAEADSKHLAALERDLIEQWQPWAHDGGLAVQHHMILLTARK